MKSLNSWFHEQLDQNLVEPNSGLGQAIRYMIKHWNALTLFLKVPNVPLDNNLCERALRKAILHRKNSLFYKTEHGARVAGSGEIGFTLAIDIDKAGDDDDGQEKIEGFMRVVHNHFLIVTDQVADCGQDYDPDAGA